MSAVNASCWWDFKGGCQLELSHAFSPRGSWVPRASIWEEREGVGKKEILNEWARQELYHLMWCCLRSHRVHSLGRRVMKFCQVQEQGAQTVLPEGSTARLHCKKSMLVEDTAMGILICHLLGQVYMPGPIAMVREPWTTYSKMATTVHPWSYSSFQKMKCSSRFTVGHPWSVEKASHEQSICSLIPTWGLRGIQWTRHANNRFSEILLIYSQGVDFKLWSFPSFPFPLTLFPTSPKTTTVTLHLLFPQEKVRSLCYALTFTVGFCQAHSGRNSH